MIYGNQSISHYSTGNVVIWMSMAFQAGFLNIGGLVTGHKIVSHVTGFATQFGLELNTHGAAAWTLLFIPFWFLLGSAISGYFVDIRLKLKKKPRYYLSFGIIFFLILYVWYISSTGYFGVFGEQDRSAKGIYLLSLLSLICGIQNGAISIVSKSVIRTTHLTGITTDLGLGLVRVLYRNKLGKDLGEEGKANFMRIGIIYFFIMGSVVGGVSFHRYGFDAFLVPVLISGVLFFLMLYFQLIKPKFFS